MLTFGEYIYVILSVSLPGGSPLGKNLLNNTYEPFKRDPSTLLRFAQDDRPFATFQEK